MKRISKLLVNGGKVLTIAALIAGVAFVQPVAAAGCATISATATQSMAAINGKLGTMNSDFSARLTTIGTNLDALDKKIVDARAAAATNFDTKISDLESTQNLSDAQKTAIEQYKTDMQAAEKTRETAVDAARATYRTGVTDAVKTHQDKLSSAANNYKVTISSLFDYGKENCSAQNKSDNWYAQTIAYVKSYTTQAKSTFAAARGSDDTKNKISQLAQTRNQAITDANKAFTDAASGYAATLATALNVVKDTTSLDQTQTQDETAPDQTAADATN